MQNRIVAARDPIGVTTLYVGFNSNAQSLYFASEMKSLCEDCDQIMNFPPGNCFSMFIRENSFEDFQLESYLTRYYNPKWWDEQRIPTIQQFPKPNYVALRASLEAAVHKRLMADVPFGVLLSGGLDSSLVAAIASRAIEQYYKVRYTVDVLLARDLLFVLLSLI